MKSGCLKQLIMMSSLGLALIFGTNNLADAQDRSDSKQDSKKYEQELIKKWFDSEEYRKKILQEDIKRGEEEKKRRSDRTRNFWRNDARKQRDGRRRSNFRRRSGVREIEKWRKNGFSDFNNDRINFNQEEENTKELWSEINKGLWKESYESLFKKVESEALTREKNLQGQNRLALYSIQQKYMERLQEDNSRLKNLAGFRKPQGKDYRYYSRQSWHYTNKAGAEMLQRAINVGYQQGVLIGTADRTDGTDSNSENSYIYQDAIYGYDNLLIKLEEYQYYFRQGFWRGYEDGYGKHFNYGKQENGEVKISETVVSKIIEFKFE